jgi:Mn2+/Fe2+ NRAMP family transporter
MRFFLILLIFSPVLAFVPVIVHKVNNVATTTNLDLHRRDLLITGVLGLIVAPEITHAKSSTFFYDDKIEEKPPEPSQMATDGKYDLNSAFVVRIYESHFDQLRSEFDGGITLARSI